MSEEGSIHLNTFTIGEGSRVSMSMTSMATGVAELGVAIYEALDWSVSDDVSVERTVARAREHSRCDDFRRRHRASGRGSW